MERKPLLVTGAAGFVGARFVDSCNRLGQKVVSVDALSYFDTRSEHRGIDFGTRVDREHLFEWLRENKNALGGIVHLGACTDTTELDWDYLSKMNLEYSKSIWAFAAENRVPLVYASSAATYGDGAQGYKDDESQMTLLKPLNPYGDSKLQFDLWALEEEKKGHSPPAWAGFKFFNVYGFGERHKEKMSSVVIQAYDQIKKSGQMRLFKSHKAGISDGHQKRDFIFVEDVVDVLHFALKKPIRRGIFNLGTGKARTFLDLAKITFQKMGAPEKIEFVDTPVAIRDRYQYFTQADMEKLIKEGYSRPFTSLEQGIENSITRLNQSK